MDGRKDGWMDGLGVKILKRQLSKRLFFFNDAEGIDVTV